MPDGNSMTLLLKHPITAYLTAICLTAIATMLSLLLYPWLTYTVALLFFVATAFSTYYCGIKPGVLAILLSAIAIDIWLIPPFNQLNLTDFSNNVRLVIFCGAALSISFLIHILKQTQLKTERLSREIHDLYNLAPCGYHSLNAKGEVVHMNATELSWLGYSREEIVGQKRFSDLIAREHLPIFQESFPKFVERGYVDNLEMDMIRKDGTRLPIRLSATAIRDKAGNFVMSRSTIVDQTSIKQREAILQESERRWRSLLENVKLLVVSLDSQGNVEYVNPFFLEMTGYQKEEVLGYHWFAKFLLPEQAQHINAVFLDLLEHEFDTYYENSIVIQSGEQRQIAWNNTLRRDSQGKIIGTTSIGEDITQRQLVDRMKNDFVSIVSHELRTPLTGIRGSLGLLATGIYDQNTEKRQRMIAIAAEQSDRLVRLINDILDLKRLESGAVKLEMEVCSATDLIEASMQTFRSTAKLNPITLSIATEGIKVWAAPDAIVQTLVNLISNAIKFSPAESEIMIQVQAIDHAARFSIKDQGCGIPVENLESIFEQFQQVDASVSRQKGGTGLGLAICQRIVQQHQGQIWVESEVGKGSEFYFTLPIVESISNPLAL